MLSGLPPVSTIHSSMPDRLEPPARTLPGPSFVAREEPRPSTATTESGLLSRSAYAVLAIPARLRGAGGRLAAWWGERRCLAALGGQAAPDGYGRLELPGQRPVSFLLELDRATEDHERLRQKARRYARALPRSPLAQESPLIVLAVPSPARRDNLARTFAVIGSPIHTVVWTPRRSPLEALIEALAAPRRQSRPPLTETDVPEPEHPNSPPPPPAPHA